MSLLEKGLHNGAYGPGGMSILAWRTALVLWLLLTAPNTGQAQNSDQSTHVLKPNISSTITTPNFLANSFQWTQIDRSKLATQQIIEVFQSTKDPESNPQNVLFSLASPSWFYGKNNILDNNFELDTQTIQVHKTSEFLGDTQARITLEEYFKGSISTVFNDIPEEEAIPVINHLRAEMDLLLSGKIDNIPQYIAQKRKSYRLFVKIADNYSLVETVKEYIKGYAIYMKADLIARMYGMANANLENWNKYSSLSAAQKKEVANHSGRLLTSGSSLYSYTDAKDVHYSNLKRSLDNYAQLAEYSKNPRQLYRNLIFNLSYRLRLPMPDVMSMDIVGLIKHTLYLVWIGNNREASMWLPGGEKYNKAVNGLGIAVFFHMNGFESRNSLHNEAYAGIDIEEDIWVYIDAAFNNLTTEKKSFLINFFRNKENLSDKDAYTVMKNVMLWLMIGESGIMNFTYLNTAQGFLQQTPDFISAMKSNPLNIPSSSEATLNYVAYLFGMNGIFAQYANESYSKRIELFFLAYNRWEWSAIKLIREIGINKLPQTYPNAIKSKTQQVVTYGLHSNDPQVAQTPGPGIILNGL